MQNHRDSPNRIQSVPLVVIKVLFELTQQRWKVHTKLEDQNRVVEEIEVVEPEVAETEGQLLESLDNQAIEEIEAEKKPVNKGGRPRVELDWESIDKLLAIQSTVAEIASWFNCHPETIDNACKREHGISISKYSALKRGAGCISLRRKQFQQALAGNTTMLIWLGKQYLFQGDKVELSGQDGGPIVFKAEFDYGTEPTPSDTWDDGGGEDDETGGAPNAPAV